MTPADPGTRWAQPLATVPSADPVSAGPWDRPADPGPACGASLETRLGTSGADREEAVRELHALMLRGCRHQIARMRSLLPGFGARDREDLAAAAADDAVVALLAKLHTFEGRSRFTTWAYKFAILQAATEVRRHAWSRREVPLEDPDTAHWSGPATAAGPAELAVATDLAAEVGRALDVALTAYQRRIAVALLVDDVPIDVLAERLGTTRGALYKTLHVARTRVRAHLEATGHLEPERRLGGRTAAGTTASTTAATDEGDRS